MLHFYKANLVRSLIFRAFFSICSTYVSFHNELSRITRLLKGNSFPLPLIDKIARSFLDHIFSSTCKKRIANDDKPGL